MPVRINLKELFGSDSQEISVDKLNFNFNKLLSLGIGLEGAKGLTGGTGSLGPSGVQGEKGEKGNQWFVGNSDPNLLTFPGLLDEDFYVLSDNSQIWQYDLVSDTWNVLIDLGGIVNNYLASSGSTFVRGFGEGSPQDNRFIMFPNRGNTVIDQQEDSLGSGVSNNDVLFLNNFNETVQGTVIDILDDLSTGQTNNYYNALHKIYVDASSSIDNRYHIELGSLYDYGSSSDFKLSTLTENFKIRHQVIDGTTEKLFNAVFSLTKTETDPISEIGHNGIFDFQFTKFLASPSVKKEGFVQIGSRYSHNENAKSYVEFDGINFNVDGAGDAGIGIGENFDNAISDIDGRNYLVLASDNSTVTGVMVDSNLYQDNGNIEQLGTSVGDIKTSIDAYGSTAIPLSVETYGNAAFAISGNYLYQSIGTFGSWPSNREISVATLPGSYYITDITNPNAPTNISREKFNGQSNDSFGETKLPGTAAVDMVASGNILVTITNQQRGFHNDNPVSNASQSNLQTVNANFENGPDWSAYGYIGGDSTDNKLDGAYRIKAVGDKVLVVTNHLRDWGDSVPAADSQFGETGHAVLVDITDPSSPDISSYKSYPRTHFLDLDVYNNHSVSLAIEFDDPSTNMEFPGWKLKIITQDLNESGGFIFGNFEIFDLLTSTDSVTESASNDLVQFNKFGAVAVSGGHIFAIHANALYTLRYNPQTEDYSVIDTLQYDPDPEMRAMDIEVIGSSLIILGATGNSGSAHAPTDTHIIKVDVRDPENPSIVSKTDIGDSSASRMIVNGNNIYVNKTDGTSEYLTPIEIDGFKTDSARIGSIHSTKLNVEKDITTGNSILVGQSITVGQGGINTIGNISTQGVSSSADINVKGGNKIKLYTDNSSNYSSISYPTGASDIDYALPSTAPSAGQVLTSDAAGFLSWNTSTNAGWIDDGAVVRLVDGVDQVGIGTNAPDANSKLHIFSVLAINSPFLVVDNASSSAQADASMKFTRSSVSNTFTIGIDGTDNNFKINTGSVLSNAPEFTIQESTGFVGIMDQTPSYNLDINGTLRTINNTYLSTSTGQLTVGTTSPSISTNTRGLFVYGKAHIGYNTSTSSSVPTADVFLGALGCVEIGSKSNFNTNYNQRYVTINGAYSTGNPNLQIAVNKGGPGSSNGYPTFTMNHSNYGSSWYFNMENSGSNGVADILDGRYIFGVGDNGNVFTGHGPGSGNGTGDPFELNPFSQGGGLDIKKNLRVRVNARVDGSLLIGAGSSMTFTGTGALDKRYHGPSSADWQGINSGTVKLNVGGGIGCVYIVTTSDERLKENIVDVNNSLDKILKLRPVFYNWNDKSDNHSNIPQGGFLAQEVESIIPEAIRIFSDTNLEGGTMSLHYDTILTVAVGAIKDQNVIIEDLKSKNKELETRLAAIESHLGL